MRVLGCTQPQVVVTQDGEFYKCTFDPEIGGACKNERYDKFVDDATGGGAQAGAAGAAGAR